MLIITWDYIMMTKCVHCIVVWGIIVLSLLILQSSILSEQLACTDYLPCYNQVWVV